jgi:oxygen-independent coproporphyrinogen-3 oxidase
MWPYHAQLLATAVPRYTSYPTAAEFTGEVGPRDVDEILGAISGDVSLYVHIPFCERICWYCGCNTSAANREQRLTSYLDALHREIALVGRRLPPGTRVRRIAYGGGSPNAIDPEDFLRLHEALGRTFRLHDPAISIELDPRTLTPSWGAAIGRVGARHASLGVQTFVPKLQEAIGRLQPLCMIDRSVRILRKAGVASLNFDLMYGLPGQTRDDLASTLSLSTAMGADRIALFGYAHVPHVIPRQRRIDATLLPDQRERFAMAWLGHEQLVEAGYDPIGFDHFALPGDGLAQAASCGRLRRNFQGFTDDTAETLIGLGASAISSFPSLLVQNEKNAGRYRMLLSQDRLPARTGCRRSAEDRRRGSVIEDLLCRGRAQLGREELGKAAGPVRPFVEAGLCELKDDILAIRPDGLPYSRVIAALFDPYRQSSPRHFSSAI